jgi:hypothetical protein
VLLLPLERIADITLDRFAFVKMSAIQAAIICLLPEKVNQQRKLAFSFQPKDNIIAVLLCQNPATIISLLQI